MKKQRESAGAGLVALALPILLEQVLRALMGTVNTFMVSRVSDDAAASVGVANQVLNVVMIATTMMASGAAVLINQHLGAGSHRKAAKLMMNCLTVSVVLGLMLSTLAMCLAPALVALLGLDEALRGDAIVYVRMVGASCVFQFMSSMVATYFRCKQKAHLPMVVIAFNNAVNLLGSYLVVNHLLPVEGVAGIALVRLVSEGLGLGLILLMLMRQSWGLQKQDLWQIDFAGVGKITRLGLMTGMEGISYTMAQLVTTRFITMLPAVMLSAKVYVQSVNNYTYMAGLAVGSAAQIICGHLIGAGKKEEAYRFMNRSWAYVLGLNLIFSIGFFLLSSQIIGIFTDSAQIQTVAHTLLLIDIITCAGRSMNHSFNYGLRSAGYVLWPMIIASTSIWLVSVGLGYVFSCTLSLGVVGLWISAALDEWLRGLLAAWQWLKRKWTRTTMIERAEQGA